MHGQGGPRRLSKAGTQHNKNPTRVKPASDTPSTEAPTPRTQNPNPETEESPALDPEPPNPQSLKVSSRSRNKAPLWQRFLQSKSLQWLRRLPVGGLLWKEPKIGGFRVLSSWLGFEKGRNSCWLLFGLAPFARRPAAASAESRSRDPRFGTSKKPGLRLKIRVAPLALSWLPKRSRGSRGQLEGVAPMIGFEGWWARKEPKILPKKGIGRVRRMLQGF